MLPKIINFTLYLVIQEIDNILNDCSDTSYQAVFALEEYRHTLSLHVLNQIPNYYTIVEDIQELPEDPTVFYRSLEEKINLQALIYESMACILQENLELIGSDVLQKNQL